MALTDLTFDSTKIISHRYAVYMIESAFTSCETLPDTLDFTTITTKTLLEAELASWEKVGEMERGAHLFTEDGTTVDLSDETTLQVSKMLRFEGRFLNISKANWDAVWGSFYNNKVNIMLYDCEDLDSIIVYYGLLLNVNGEILNNDLNSLTINGSFDVNTDPSNYWELASVTS
jgi:hypothetical protein